MFGTLQVRTGDFVILPRGTTHRWIPAHGEPLKAYCIESTTHMAPAKRYLSRYGQFLEHSPYCERDLTAAEEPLLVEWTRTDVEVLVKHRTAAGVTGTRFVYRATRSTSSAGTAACTRTPSTSATSSRSPAACTNRRRCTRSSRAPAS